MLMMSIKSIGQTICFEVDSLKIYSLPWDLKTPLSLNEEGVKIFAKENFTFSKIKTIDNAEIIEEFLSILAIVKRDTLNLSIDGRLVIDFYHENSILSTFIISSDGYFTFDKRNYIRNSGIIRWIKSNITEFD